MRLILLPLLAIGGLLAHPAHADECVVHVTSGLGAPEWSVAIDELRGVLASDAGDCSSIEVVVDARAGAAVTMTTRDLRHASRRIATPAELVPLVQALLVVAPPDDPEPPPSPSPSVALSPSSSAEPEPARSEAPAPRLVPRSLRPVAFAGVGATLTSAASPTAFGQISGSLLLRDDERWELGAFGRWELEHHLAGGKTHSSLGAGGGGFLVGRREPVGRVDIVYGATIAGYLDEKERNVHGVRTTREEESFFDPRAGAFFGGLFPAVANVRVRAQLGAELSPLASAAPGLGVGLALGIETGGER